MMLLKRLEWWWKLWRWERGMTPSQARYWNILKDIERGAATQRALRALDNFERHHVKGVNPD